MSGSNKHRKGTAKYKQVAHWDNPGIKEEGQHDEKHIGCFLHQRTEWPGLNRKECRSRGVHQRHARRHSA
eukprot:1155310-Pelagomonas_calceolata.AAC.4